MKSKTSVSTFTTTQGHWSINQSIIHLLNSKGVKTHTNFHITFLFSAYIWIYKHYPHLFKSIYSLSTSPIILQSFKLFTQHNFQKQLAQEIDLQKPSLIISTWFFLNPTLEKICQQKDIPFFNIIANPRSIHPSEVVSSGINFVFDSHAQTTIKKTKPYSQSIITGWFTRPQFQPTTNKPNLRSRLHLPTKKLTFFLNAGSEGSYHILKLINQLKNPKKPATFIVACGKNQTLFQRIFQLKQQNLNSNIQLFPLPFTKKIHLYLQASDLVIGKAGPNYLFEAVATHTPFLATSHIHGQEDGNLEIIRDYKIGWIQEDLQKAAQLINQIIEKPKMLNRFQPHLKKLAIHNQNAPKILHQILKSIITE